MANISQQIQSWFLVALDTLLLLAQVQQLSPSHDFLLPSFPFVHTLENHVCSDNLSHMVGNTGHIESSTNEATTGGGNSSLFII